MTANHTDKEPQDTPIHTQTQPTTPIFTASGTTILGVKLNRPLTIIAKKKYIQHCQNEAAFIISSILIGYLQWLDSKNLSVTIKPPILAKNAPSKSVKQHQLEQLLIDKLAMFHHGHKAKQNITKPVTSGVDIKIPESVHHHPNAFFGTIFDVNTQTIKNYIGEQPFMVTSELNSLAPKRWRPLFMHNHNAPWGWPTDGEILKKSPPHGVGPLLPLPSAKQQIIGMVHGCCLCSQSIESQSKANHLQAYEWPTMAKNINTDSPSWCLGCAFYLSAIGYNCPSINLSSIPSWIAPRESLIPISAQFSQQQKHQSSACHFQLFSANMNSWMLEGLRTLNKKQYRSRLKSISRTARGKMIIPLMLKKLTAQNEPVATEQIDAALLFEDALTLPIELSALINQVIGRLKVQY